MDRLKAFATGLRRTGLTVQPLVEDGTPCKVILEAVKELSPDLLVLGVHGIHRGLNHLLIGSNTEKILHLVSCPTLSVGAHVLAGIDLKLPLTRILFCSDFSPQAAAATPYALLLGQEFNVPVEICHLLPIPYDADFDTAMKVTGDYCTALRSKAPGIAEQWCNPTFNLKRAFTLDQILERAEHSPSALIVLGIRPKSQIDRHLHDSLAYQLLTRAVCPVLSIRPISDDS